MTSPASIDEFLDRHHAMERQERAALADRFRALPARAQVLAASYMAGHIARSLELGTDCQGQDAFRASVAYAEGLVERGEVAP